ncbi:hypothetical protein EIN_490120 [Entamoeba invadens IP1]|uniref:FCH domain-containing protein n=1 Tax=Entamoeba invadens IP1 TaxID=370355 RepID=A0A0A1U3X5_ENTIV|nr:hypothetical protein EIN_490120 [Entamoeba invadens IP1]ELP88943.1 hypothetical protein EIN_490120 [Entamoeba invadens IP1]|eukprot:XP_004255714.1 hypothetical protein EIN_490120 [Entamoeba invadens IP1]
MKSLVFEVPAVTSFVDSFSSLTSGCIAYFHEKAEIEKDYGNRLLTLSKAPLRGASVCVQRLLPKDNMSTTLKNFIEKYTKQTTQLAECHINASKFIEENIIKTTKAAALQLEQRMSLINKEMNQRVRQYSDMVATIVRIKENKESATKELTKIRKQRPTKGKKAYHKFECKEGTLTDSIKKSNCDLKNCVALANKIRLNVYGKDMEDALEKSESVAKEWNCLIVGMFELGNDLDIELLKNSSKYCLKVQEGVKEISWDKDLEEFILKWKNVHVVNEIVLKTEDVNETPTVVTAPNMLNGSDSATSSSQDNQSS